MIDNGFVNCTKKTEAKGKGDAYFNVVRIHIFGFTLHMQLVVSLRIERLINLNLLNKFTKIKITQLK